MKNYDELETLSRKLEALADELKKKVIADINKGIEHLLDATSEAEDGETDKAMDSITDAARKFDINLENDIASMNIIRAAIEEAGNEEEHDPCPGYPIGR